MPNPNIPAGDTYSELVTLSAYPASSGWVLNSRFTPRAVGGAVISFTGTAEGAAHRLSVAASTTAGWVAGSYAWVQWVELGAESYTVASGQLTITPNLRTAGVGSDARSQAQRALDDYKAAFAAWTPTTRRYRILDREREFNTVGEILTAINYWQVQVDRETAKAQPNSAAATQGGRFYIRAR